MPTFEYHAIHDRDKDNEDKSFVGGVVVAKSREDAMEKLRKHGLRATMLRKARGIMGLLRWFDADIR